MKNIELNRPRTFPEVSANTSSDFYTSAFAEPSADQRWRWWLMLILVSIFSLGFRVYYITHAQVLQPVNDQAHVRADGVEYYAYARNLVFHRVFSKDPEGKLPIVRDNYRDPGYPLFLAGWMEILPKWDMWYPVVLLSQSSLSALSVVLAMFLSRRWMSLPWQAGAGLLISVWPHSVSMASFILSETLFSFFCILSLFLLDKAFRTQSLIWTISSGIGFACGALTNAVLLPFIPLFGLYLAWRRLISARMLAMLLISAMLLPTAWAIRNTYLRYSNENSSTGRALGNLVVGSWPDFYRTYYAAMKGDPAGAVEMQRVNAEVALIQTNPTAALSSIMRRMTNAPSQYLQWYLSKPGLLWGWNIRVGQGDIYVYPTRYSPFNYNLIYRSIISVCRALNTLLFIMMLAGCISVFRTRRKTPVSLDASAVLIIFVTSVFTVLQAEPRYSVPYRPLEILLAIYAANRAFIWLANLRSARSLSL